VSADNVGSIEAYMYGLPDV